MRSIVDFATRLLPPESRDRWNREWSAELDAAPDRIRFALGICTAAVKLAHAARAQRTMLRAARLSRIRDGRYSETHPPYDAGSSFWA